MVIHDRCPVQALVMPPRDQIISVGQGSGRWRDEDTDVLPKELADGSAGRAQFFDRTRQKAGQQIPDLAT